MYSKRTEAGNKENAAAAVATTAGKKGRSMPAAPLQLQQPAKAVVQCAFGFEMESNIHYVVPRDKQQALPDKRAPLVKGSKIELQAENAGPDRNVEFATPKGGLDSGEDMKQAMLEFALIAKKLKNVPMRGSLGVEALKDETHNIETVEGYDIHNLPPGLKSGFAPQEGKGTPFSGFMQATLGIPLAKMPAFFDLLSKSSIADNTKKELYNNIVPHETKTGGLSADAIGLITLINHIIKAGTPTAKAEFPKSVVGIMNRTDFRTMFHLLPEIKEQRIKQEEMVAIILAAVTEDNKDRPVFQQTFGVTDKREQSYPIPLTIRKWITNLPEKDELALLNKNFGHLENKTDTIDNKEVPVVELRAIANNLPMIDGREKMGKWLERAYAILGIYEEINGLEKTDVQGEIKDILEKVYSPEEAEQAINQLEAKKEETPGKAGWVIPIAILVLGAAAVAYSKLSKPSGQ